MKKESNPNQIERRKTKQTVLSNVHRRKGSVGTHVVPSQNLALPCFLEEGSIATTVGRLIYLIFQKTNGFYTENKKRFFFSILEQAFSILFQLKILFYLFIIISTLYSEEELKRRIYIYIYIIEVTTFIK